MNRPVYWQMEEGITEVAKATCGHTKYPLVPSAPNEWLCRACGMKLSEAAQPASAPDALIERLRSRYDEAIPHVNLWPLPNLHEEAADALAAAQKRIAELERVANQLAEGLETAIALLEGFNMDKERKAIAAYEAMKQMKGE